MYSIQTVYLENEGQWRQWFGRQMPGELTLSTRVKIDDATFDRWFPVHSWQMDIHTASYDYAVQLHWNDVKMIMNKI